MYRYFSTDIYDISKIDVHIQHILIWISAITVEINSLLINIHFGQLPARFLK